MRLTPKKKNLRVNKLDVAGLQAHRAVGLQAYKVFGSHA